MPNFLHRIAAAGLLAALALAGCQARPATSPPAATGVGEGVPADEAALLARIRAEIGDARCSSDAQCRTLAVGHKPCGGPQQWWAWSTANARAEPLQRWAAELAALQQQRQQAEGRVSDCRYLPDPGAVCEAQRCVPSTRSLSR